MHFFLPIMVLTVLFSGVEMALALEPHEILVLANKRSSASLRIADYYAEKRQIPRSNLLYVSTVQRETCSRKAYEQEIEGPVKKYLKGVVPHWRIRCILLVYGIPLRIAPPVDGDALNGPAGAENKQSRSDHETVSSDTHKSLTTRTKTENEKKQTPNQKIDRDLWASVDSEIALIRAPRYALGGWVQNPYFVGFKIDTSAPDRNAVLMVSRLDASSESIVKRMIDDALEAEANGLNGTAYFDARWPDAPGKPSGGYALYDRSIHRAAASIEKSKKLAVVLDHQKDLFGPGQCPDAALYCGWYSLGKYVDAFSWRRGAVGYHIASSECTTLKNNGSTVWCKKMLEDGVCATIGPVGEPYVQGFPLPALFFRFLVDRGLTLAESYLLSLPYLSWKMVLVGDPLYRPFPQK